MDKNVHVKDLNLNTRLSNILKRENIKTLADIEALGYTGLKHLKHLGKTGLKELIDACNRQDAGIDLTPPKNENKEWKALRWFIVNFSNCGKSYTMVVYANDKNMAKQYITLKYAKAVILSIKKLYLEPGLILQYM